MLKMLWLMKYDLYMYITNYACFIREMVYIYVSNVGTFSDTYNK